MRRALSAFFLILGTAIMLGTLAAVPRSLNKPAAILLAPEDAAVCAEELAESLSQGKFGAARERIWGLSEQPETWEPPDAACELIWQAYLDSVECAVASEGRATQTGMAWDMTVSTMDIARVADAVSETAETILGSQVGEEEMNALLCEAAEQAIREEPDRIVREVQLDLARIDGEWYALPEEQLMLVLSGRKE